MKSSRFLPERWDPPEGSKWTKHKVWPVIMRPLKVRFRAAESVNWLIWYCFQQQYKDELAVPASAVGKHLHFSTPRKPTRKHSGTVGDGSNTHKKKDYKSVNDTTTQRQFKVVKQNQRKKNITDGGRYWILWTESNSWLQVGDFQRYGLLITHTMEDINCMEALNTFSFCSTSVTDVQKAESSTFVAAATSASISPSLCSVPLSMLFNQIDIQWHQADKADKQWACL